MDKRRDLVVGEGEVEMSNHQDNADVILAYAAASMVTIMAVFMGSLILSEVYDIFLRIDGCYK